MIWLNTRAAGPLHGLLQHGACGCHLLLLEHMVVEVLLQLLIGQIDAELQTR
jgi:hypothetical protein